MKIVDFGISMESHHEQTKSSSQFSFLRTVENAPKTVTDLDPKSKMVHPA